MTTNELKASTLSILNARYPTYMQKKRGERIVLAASVLTNDLKVRETSYNGGPAVEAIIGSTGLNPKGDYSWCAAAVEFCCEVAGTGLGPPDPKSASVAQWRNWGSNNNRLSSTPKRGSLALFVRPDGTGHIEVVAQVYSSGKLRTYGANTSPGTSGSQSNGDGYYERIRAANFFQRYIDMD